MSKTFIVVSEFDSYAAVGKRCIIRQWIGFPPEIFPGQLPGGIPFNIIVINFDESKSRDQDK